MARVDEVRQRLAEVPSLVAEHDVPGVSVAVLVDGQVVQATAGVINRRTGEPVLPDTLFQIQSITKVWTATLVMQLVDGGLIELDAPVRRYLPTFHTADEAASAEITVQHLLTHTGGFEGDLWAPTTSGDDALERFVDDLVAAAPQRARPGEFFSYCSAGYGVLGRLVEVLRGMPYPAAFRRHLAEPLGIDELAFSADEALAFRTAIGHGRSEPGATLRPLKTWASMPPSNPAAGNQLAMSARALLTLAGMHLADGVTPQGTRVLSASSARAMRDRRVDQPGLPGASNGQGLGWMVPNRAGLIEHGGDAIGVEAILQFVPEAGVAVAMLANANGALGPIHQQIVAPLLTDLAGVPPATKPPLPPLDARRDPTRFVGRYETRVSVEEITADADGRLWLESSERNEAVDMAVAAGVPVDSRRYEVRPLDDGDTVVLLTASGEPARVAQFHGTDASGRAAFFRTSRAAPRAD